MSTYEEVLDECATHVNAARESLRTAIRIKDDGALNALDALLLGICSRLQTISPRHETFTPD